LLDQWPQFVALHGNNLLLIADTHGLSVKQFIELKEEGSGVDELALQPKLFNIKPTVQPQ
jgi:hypothetical protein